MSKIIGRSKSEYSIQTVRNAMRILESFGCEEELGVSELSRRLTLHKNNVFRLLATLEESGYVEQSDENERYRLGTSCLELGQSYSRGRNLLRRARPILESMSHDLRESSHLGILKGFEVVHLDGEQSQQMLLSALRVGTRLPLHCTALGKVLIGCSDSSAREAYDRTVVTQPLEARTEATIVDRDKLVEHLRGVSVQGFAVDIEECEVGLRCAAAPVFDGANQLRAALSVSGPSSRLSEDRLLREVVPIVTAAAQNLSHQLGA